MASQALLPNVQNRHWRSAARWDFLAEEVERCERGQLARPGGANPDFA